MPDLLREDGSEEKTKLSGYKPNQAQVSKREFGQRHSSLPLPPTQRGLRHSPDSWLPASYGSTIMGGFLKTKAI